MRRVLFGLVAAMLATLIVLTACEGGDEADVTAPRTPRPPEDEGINLRLIGLVGTMTGPDGWRGEDAFEGADLGVQVLNEALPEGATPFELRSLDDMGDSKRALELVRELAGLDRTVGVIYAGPPDALPAAEEALARAGVPAVLCYGDLYGARRLRPHVFQVSPSFLWEARRIASYLVGDRRYERVGLLATRLPEGDVARAALVDALRSQGARRPAVARYRVGDPKEALRELKRAHVEAVVVEGSPQDFAATLARLEAIDATYVSTAKARIASAPGPLRRTRSRGGHWRPQVVGFDLAIAASLGADLPAGTVAAESYARGVHYLPIPPFRRFRKRFRDWWDAEPLGWEERAYEAARAIGWAARRAGPDEDVAGALEGLEGRRFGGLTVTFGPDDHTSVNQTDVGLWVVPRPGAAVREREALPKSLPWVPLARGFAIDGRSLDIQPRDWRYLVRRPPPASAPPPRFTRFRFGVVTLRSDPVH